MTKGGKNKCSLMQVKAANPPYCLHPVLFPQKALEAYNSCLQWIADNNLTIRRDVLEGMARCCTKLGQRDRALDLVDLLVNAFFYRDFIFETRCKEHFIVVFLIFR